MKNVMLAASAIAIAAGSALASSVPARFINDGPSGGGGYAATIDGVDVKIGVLGWSDGTAGASFDADNIFDSVSIRGNVVGLFNGQDRNFFGGSTALSRTYDSGDPLFSVSGDAVSGVSLSEFGGLTQITGGRHFRAILVAFTGDRLTITNGNGGTATFISSTLGDLGEISAPVIPLPGAAGMALIGMAGVAARRRRA